MNKLNITIIFSVITFSMLSSCTRNSTEVRTGSADHGYDQQKVVYHINNINSAHLTFRNINNHMTTIGDRNAKMVVVAHAAGAYTFVNGVCHCCPINITQV